MSAQGRPVADDLISELARSQHAFVKRTQLLEAGVSRRQIELRRRRGLLSEWHRGVYLAGPMPPTQLGIWKAATLAVDESALSHFDSLAFAGLMKGGGGPVHLTRVGGGRHTREGLVLHRARQLPDDWKTERDGVPAVSPMLAIVQCAGRMGPVEIRHVLDQAEAKEVLDIPTLDSFLAINPKIKGRAKLIATAEPFRKQLVRADTGLGTRFLRWCHERNLPMPAPNVPIAGLEVDFHWGGTPLIVETDGFDPHRSRTAFDRDRERWARLTAFGYSVIVVTDRRLRSDPNGLYEEITTVLRRCGRL